MEEKTMTEDTPKHVSRRNFIKGVVASGAAVSSASYLWRSSTLLGQQPSAPGSVERLITLNVNGQDRRVDVLKQETLAMTLRYKLGLTGTKLGCDRSECGACTVLVDDVPRYSCSVLTHMVRGKKIRTVEGLAASDGTLHPVQQAFKECHGLQCGYCTPGMVMNILGRFEEKQPLDLSDDGIRELLSGNLCRCTGYLNIIAAVRRAAELLGRT